MSIERPFIILTEGENANRVTNMIFPNGKNTNRVQNMIFHDFS